MGAANWKHTVRRTKQAARNATHHRKQKRKLPPRAPKKKRLQARTHSLEGTNEEVQKAAQKQHKTSWPSSSQTRAFTEAVQITFTFSSIAQQRRCVRLWLREWALCGRSAQSRSDMQNLRRTRRRPLCRGQRHSRGTQRQKRSSIQRSTTTFKGTSGTSATQIHARSVSRRGLAAARSWKSCKKAILAVCQPLCTAMLHNDTV